MLTPEGLASMMAQNTGLVWLELLTVSHPDMETFRVVNNTEAVTSNGQTYSHFPFTGRLPVDDGERQPTAEIRISNVGREIIDVIRGLDGLPQVELSVITADSPDDIQAGPLTLDVVDARYGLEEIAFRLSYERILSEPFPAASFTPDRFPRLFN